MLARMKFYMALQRKVIFFIFHFKLPQGNLLDISFFEIKRKEEAKNNQILPLLSSINGCSLRNLLV